MPPQAKINTMFTFKDEVDPGRPAALQRSDPCERVWDEEEAYGMNRTMEQKYRI
jgi:hypothetical protein